MKHHVKGIGGRRIGGSKSLARVIPVGLSGLGSTSGLLIFVAFVLLMFSAFSPQALISLRVGISDMVAPALNVVSMPLQRAATFVRNVSGLAEIQAENARLADENQKLREWYQMALLFEAENKSLRELLNVKVQQSNKYITAQILSDTSSAFAKSLLVEAGREDGVRKGQAVISGEGVVGRVIEVGDQVSRVLLINDMSSRVPVLIEDTRQHAIFSGDGAQAGFLTYLSVDSQIKVGARIVTSGQGGVFPMGLPVGVVHAVKNGRAEVTPFADFTRMMYVRIIDAPEDPNLVEGALE